MSTAGNLLLGKCKTFTADLKLCICVCHQLTCGPKATVIFVLDAMADNQPPSDKIRGGQMIGNQIAFISCADVFIIFIHPCLK